MLIVWSPVNPTQELAKPPKKAKQSVQKVQRGAQNLSLRVLRSLRQRSSTPFQHSLRGCAAQHYKSEGAEVAVKKVRLSPKDARHALPVVPEPQVLAKRSRGESKVCTPFTTLLLDRAAQASYELAPSLFPGFSTVFPLGRATGRRPVPFTLPL